MSIRVEATIEDLYNVPDNGKAEIVDGELVLINPMGDLPATAAGEISISLRAYSHRTGYGRAYMGRVGFIVNLPNRKSFSPDAAFYVGARSGGKFLDGTPIFAVEVRSESDYGPRAEQAMARKRNDYFAAGTQAVWDVDVLKDEVVRVYRFDSPNQPTTYHRGETAEAEPAVPNWAMAVDDLFL